MEKCSRPVTAKAFLSWKHSCCICNKERETESCREAEKVGNFWFPVTSHWKDRSTASAICLTERTDFSCSSCIPFNSLSLPWTYVNIPIYTHIYIRTIRCAIWHSEKSPNWIYLRSGTRGFVPGTGPWFCWKLWHTKKGQSRDCPQALASWRIKGLAPSIQDGFDIDFLLTQQYFI